MVFVSHREHYFKNSVPDTNSGSNWYRLVPVFPDFSLKVFWVILRGKNISLICPATRIRFTLLSSVFPIFRISSTRKIVLYILNSYENNYTWRNFYEVESLNGKFLSTIFNLSPFLPNLSYFYLCGSGCTKLLNTDSILIRIHTTLPTILQYWQAKSELPGVGNFYCCGLLTTFVRILH